MKMETKPKLYPLTAAQKMHFFTLKYCPEKQVLNIGTALTILDDIDFDILRQAIARAYERCESMRIRFVEGEDGELMQYIAPREERETEFFDFTGWKYEDAENLLKEWSERPFERLHSPMNRMVMIVMPNGYKGLYLNVDHMTMDSHAIIIFLKDLIEIYCSLKFDTEYPKPLASYEKSLVKELEYKGSARNGRDREYWMENIQESEPIFTDITGPQKLRAQREESGRPELRAVKITSDSVKARHRRFHLEKEPADRLLNFCRENRIPTVCLLLMGLRTYLSKMNNNEPDVSIKSTVARRGTLLEKKSGGTRIHFFPCRTIISEDTSFIDGIHIVQESQNAIFRHADFDPIECSGMRSKHYHNGPGESYECMSLTYQPMSMRANTAELGDLKYDCKWYSNGVAASPLYLTVMHSSFDDGLDFFFEYQIGRVTDDELEYLYYYLCKILFMGIENPGMPVGEILRTV